MKKNVGLWIDHRHALIVTPKDDQEDIVKIESGAERRGWFSNPAAQDCSADNIRDRGFAADLDKYYERVIAAIRDADAILLTGPGEAKKEFQKKLQAERMGDRILAVEVADRMTDKQFAAKVRKTFATAAV